MSRPDLRFSVICYSLSLKFIQTEIRTRMHDVNSTIRVRDSLDTSAQFKDTESMTTQVIRGSLWGIGGQGAILFFSFIATPFTIRLLGTESYGFLTLINVLIGSLALSDLGMGVVSTKFGADAYARCDKEEESSVIWTALLMAIIPATIGCLLLIIASQFIVEKVLHLPSYMHYPSVLALRLVSAGLLARSVTGVLNTPQLVRLRLDLSSLINSGSMIAQVCLVPIALWLSKDGLIAAVVVVDCVAIVSLLFHTFTSWRLLPPLCRPTFDAALIEPMIKMGGGVVIASLSGIALSHGEKLVLSRCASVTALAHYSVAFTLASLLIALPTAMAQTLLPAFSRLQAVPDKAPLQRLYTYALRSILLWLAPAAILICVVAKPFFTVWAGADFGRESTLPFYILTIGVLFNSITFIPSVLLTSLGKTGIIARYYSFEALPYLLVAAVLTRQFGVVGAALSWSIRAAVDALFLLIMAHRISKFPFSPLSTIQTKYYIAMLFFLSLVAFLIHCYISSLVISIGIALMSVLCYSRLIWGRFLSREERRWLLSLLPRNKL